MPIQEEITINHVLNVLNRMYESDPEAAQELVTTHVRCNEELADDPTIQVVQIEAEFINQDGSHMATGRRWEVGILGVLNGIFGVDEKGWGCIAATFAIECPGCGLDTPKGSNEGEACPECGVKLKVGKLLGFGRLTRKED